MYDLCTLPTQCSVVFAIIMLPIWTQNTKQRRPAPKQTLFLKTRFKIACSRDWLNCRSLAAAVQPSTISDHRCYLPGCDINFQNWSDLALKKEVKMKVLSYPMLPEFRHSTAAWKVPMLRPFVLLVKETCTWRVWSIGGMTLIGYNRITRRNPCSTATLSITKLTRTGLGSNPGLHPEMAPNNRLSHGKACTGQAELNLLKY